MGQQVAMGGRQVVHCRWYPAQQACSQGIAPHMLQVKAAPKRGSLDSDSHAVACVLVGVTQW
jgi:hypothetical protein